MLDLSPGSTLLATGWRPPCDQNFGWSQGGCRVVARRSATGHRSVADGCRDDLVARRFWLLQVKPLCDQIDCRKVGGGRRQVGDWLATDCRPVAVVVDNPDTVFSHRLIADQSPIGWGPISKKLQTFCNQKQTAKIQSPTSRQPIANRLPIAPQLIAAWLPIGRQPLSDYTTV